MGKGVGVSFFLLVTGVISVLYGAFVPLMVDIIMGGPFEDENDMMYLLDLFIVLLFTNVGTYAFTTEIPLILTRKSNSAIQFLAHILSSTVATFVKELEDFWIMYLPDLNISNILIAIFYLVFPFIIVLYTMIRRFKEKKETGVHTEKTSARARGVTEAHAGED